MGEDQLLALALEGRVHAAQGETAQLIALAGNLALLPDPEIDATFAAVLEERLMTDGLPVAQSPARLEVVKPAPVVPAEPVKTNVVQLPRRRMAMRRSLVGIAVAAAMAAFPVAMAANSLPGSPFYGLKHAMERVWDARPGSTVDHAMRHLGRANERLSEAQQLIARGAPRSLIDNTLNAAQDEMTDARRLFSLDKSNPADVRRFEQFLESTQRRMAEVQAQLVGAPIVTEPAAAPRSQPSQQIDPQPVASFDGVSVDAKRSARTQKDDIKKKTGTGEPITPIEGCHAPLESNLQPYGAGDTFMFMCRQGVGITGLD